MKLTNDDVQDILQLINVSSFNELNLQTNNFKLSLRRSGDGEWTQSSQELSAPNLLEPVAAASVAAAPVAAKSALASVDGLIDVRTPLLGTFYRSPKPGSPSFVEVGSRRGNELAPSTRNSPSSPMRAGSIPSRRSNPCTTPAFTV